MQMYIDCKTKLGNQNRLHMYLSVWGFNVEKTAKFISIFFKYMKYWNWYPDIPEEPKVNVMLKFLIFISFFLFSFLIKNENTKKNSELIFTTQQQIKCKIRILYYFKFE